MASVDLLSDLASRLKRREGGEAGDLLFSAWQVDLARDMFNGLRWISGAADTELTTLWH